MSDDVVTETDIRAAMDRLLSVPRSDHCPPHLVHPDQAARGLAADGEPFELVGCANLCGTMLPIRALRALHPAPAAPTEPESR